ncbi:odorant receptor 67d-like isoform X2 [Bradysia coprophila]|uniref:odorant receptor 67d-like isoform X2 n=1 Tax=Bradysia coprophila TaxID=38358 RepID=UPI00187DBDC3|nr:odorant receptor 67d-like isoform X2 [Bradysia coprophila]XP_037040963.1 odorant receptor 67d-like isoform X2 [Bradysia coprophila]
MTSKATKKSTEDEFEEYTHQLNGSPLNVPLDTGTRNPAKFTKTKVTTDSGFGISGTRLEQIHQSDQLRVTSEQESDEDMENYLIFERDLKFFGFFGDILGVDMVFDWKPGFLFCVSLFLIFVIVSQLTYTQYLHVVNKNYYRLLETLACYGITISMVIKIVLFLKSYKAMKALINSTIRVCKANGRGYRAAKIRDRLLYNSRFYMWTTIVVMASITIFLAYPTKAFLVDHELISLLPIEYIFVDLSTLYGFITANLISSLLGVFANVATAYAIQIIVSLILNYSIFVDMFEEDVKSLDEVCNRVSGATFTYRHSFLRNFCRIQQDMDAYVVEVKRVLDGYIYHYFIASYLGQIICLFQIVVSDWKSGYAIAYGMFLEMMFYCLMGTKISSENERIISALQKSNWYSYDVYSQKVFLTLWMASTNARELRIGPLAPLSVLSGTNVVKSIYTYFNILLEVV